MFEALKGGLEAAQTGEDKKQASLMALMLKNAEIKSKMEADIKVGQALEEHKYNLEGVHSPDMSAIIDKRFKDAGVNTGLPQGGQFSVKAVEQLSKIYGDQIKLTAAKAAAGLSEPFIDDETGMVMGVKNTSNKGIVTFASYPGAKDTKSFSVKALQLARQALALHNRMNSLSPSLMSSASRNLMSKTPVLGTYLQPEVVALRAQAQELIPLIGQIAAREPAGRAATKSMAEYSKGLTPKFLADANYRNVQTTYLVGMSLSQAQKSGVSEAKLAETTPHYQDYINAYRNGNVVGTKTVANSKEQALIDLQKQMATFGQPAPQP